MAESIARYHGHDSCSGGTEPGDRVSENAIKAISKRLDRLKDQKKEINFIIGELKSLKKEILESYEHSS